MYDYVKLVYSGSDPAPGKRRLSWTTRFTDKGLRALAEYLSKFGTHQDQLELVKDSRIIQRLYSLACAEEPLTKEQAILLDICIPLAFEDGNFENRLFNYAMMHLIPNKRNITFLANRLDQVTEDRPTTNAEVKKYAEHPMEGTMGIRIQKEMLGNYLAIAEKLVEQANARQSLSPT